MDEQNKSATSDHQSDPAKTPGDGWVGEGGASHLGPATHIRSGHEHVDEADDDAEEVAEADED
ncbi:MAG: hypothetical protein GX862_11290 [Leucobacter sp.]|nr:hypothetical protein [Leucobacter sp.]